MLGIQIRQLQKEDVAEFFKLRLQSLQNHPSSFLSTYEDEKDVGCQFYENILVAYDDKNIIVGAFCENILVGIIGIYQEKLKKAAHKAKIWGMYVEKKYRKQGIAKRLLEFAIRHVQKKLTGCKLISLTVESENKAAIQLYESFGFKTWGVEKQSIFFDRQFYDELHMSLNLE